MEEFEEIPEEKWTKGQREFVGSKFETPKGGVLTVLYPIRFKKIIKFVCKCSLCSEDKELWPEGSIIKSKPELNNFSFSCGCPSKVKWSLPQYKVKLLRSCEERGYKLLRFETFQGRKTNIHLLSPFNRLWRTSIDSFLFKGCEHSSQSFVKANSSRTESRVELFYTKGGYDRDIHTFTRKPVSSGRKAWVFHCKTCEQDEYSLNGVGRTEFSISGDNLLKGVIPCRCVKGYNYNEDERYFHCNNHLKTLKGTNLRFTSVFSGNKTKLTWNCENGHKVVQDIGRFLRCKSCRECNLEAGNFNGFFPKRVKEMDNLYVISFKGNYIKVGRAFDILVRIRDKSSGLLASSGYKEDDITVLHRYTGIHEDVYKTEQFIHEVLKSKSYSYTEENWSTELFKMRSQYLVVELLENSNLEKC